MPIYEYVCNRCGKKTEAIQRMGESPLKVCPHCGGKLKKAFSAPAIQFKGSGWYVTDYARAKSESRAEKSERADKADRAEKADKADKAEKAEKTERSEKSEKGEKAAASEKKKKDKKA
jgi:putative FmdB family regulatory protein